MRYHEGTAQANSITQKAQITASDKPRVLQMQSSSEFFVFFYHTGESAQFFRVLVWKHYLERVEDSCCLALGAQGCSVPIPLLEGHVGTLPHGACSFPHGLGHPRHPLGWPASPTHPLVSLSPSHTRWQPSPARHMSEAGLRSWGEQSQNDPRQGTSSHPIYAWHQRLPKLPPGFVLTSFKI